MQKDFRTIETMVTSGEAFYDQSLASNNGRSESSPFSTGASTISVGLFDGNDDDNDGNDEGMLERPINCATAMV
jgi:hypothetical protein